MIQTEGARGPAQRDRPGEIVEIANASTIIGRQRVEVLRYRDIHVFDRMHERGQLSDRQWKAADRAMRLFTAAGMEVRGIGNAHLDDGPSLTADRDPAGD